MADPATIAALLGNALLANSDSRKGIKKFIIFTAITVFFLLLIIISIPSIIFSEFSNSDDMTLLNTYRTADISLRSRTDQWIEDIKSSTEADTVNIIDTSDFNLYILMGIDAVRYNQDYTKVTNNSITELSEMLITRSYVLKKKKGKKVLTVKIQSVPIETVCEQLGFSEQDTFIVKNIAETMMALNSNVSTEVIDTGEDIEFSPGNSEIPLFIQWDSRWGKKMYGSKLTIAQGGCGPTSLCMIIVGLTNHKSETPGTISEWAAKNGYCAGSSGSYHSLMTSGANQWGLKVKTLGVNKNAILNSLSNGNPVIGIMHKGHFTGGGHFIVLRGLSNNGKVLVNDPNSPERSKKEWDINIIVNEGDNFWAYK